MISLHSNDGRGVSSVYICDFIKPGILGEGVFTVLSLVIPFVFITQTSLNYFLIGFFISGKVEPELILTFIGMFRFLPIFVSLSAF